MEILYILHTYKNGHMQVTRLNKTASAGGKPSSRGSICTNAVLPARGCDDDELNPLPPLSSPRLHLSLQSEVNNDCKRPHPKLTTEACY